MQMHKLLCPHLLISYCEQLFKRKCLRHPVSHARRLLHCEQNERLNACASIVRMYMYVAIEFACAHSACQTQPANTGFQCICWYRACVHVFGYRICMRTQCFGNSVSKHWHAHSLRILCAYVCKYVRIYIHTHTHVCKYTYTHNTHGAFDTVCVR
jgi:hypothetical protein